MSVEILQGDCMEYMRSLPDNAFDLAIVDPPYGIGMDSRKMNGRQSKGRHAVTQSQYAEKIWDDKAPDQIYFDELMRVSKRQIIWGANHFIDRLPIPSPCWIVWFKNGQSMAPGNADCELAWTNFKTAVRIVDIPWSGFGHINLNESRIHPTQKPVKLYQWLLANYAKEGDRILDTHLGSGSSAIAAHYAGFDFVGIELDGDYYQAAKARFERETAQTTLF
jgi:site-specific DNA-methyltransferase (adenine-specific)